MGDYGQFLLMPQTGKLAVIADDWASPYDVNAGTWKPDYLRLHLTRYNVTAELTATERCSVLRLTFHEGDSGRLIVTPPAKGKIEVKGRKILGCSQEPDSFGTFFVVELDRDVASRRNLREEQGLRRPVGPQRPRRRRLRRTSRRATAAPWSSKSELRPSATKQAERNLKREVGPLGFDEVRARTAASGSNISGESKSKAAPRKRGRRSTPASIGR